MQTVHRSVFKAEDKCMPDPPNHSPKGVPFIRPAFSFAYDADGAYQTKATTKCGSIEEDIESRDDEIARWCDANPNALVADLAILLRALPRN